MKIQHSNMSAEAYSAHLQALGLTVPAAAERLGISPRMSSRYNSGKSAIPLPVALLLRALVRFEPPYLNRSIECRTCHVDLSTIMTCLRCGIDRRAT